MLRPRRDFTLVKLIVALVILVALVAFAVRWWLRSSEGGGVTQPEASIESELAKARELLAQGNASESLQVLRPLAARAGDDTAAHKEVLIALARAEQQGGDVQQAKQTLEKLYAMSKADPDYPKVAVAYARVLEESGNADEAVRIFQEVRDTAPRELRAPALTGLGRQAEGAKDLLHARDLYRQAAAESAWDSEAWNEALDALGRVNVALIFSPQDTPESKKYTVQRGDSITTIGNKLNTTQGLLFRANGLGENATLSVGQQFKYTPKDFRIMIERSRCRLFLIEKDGIFKRYSTGLGKPGHETALGSFKIGNKEKNPVWHKPGAGAIPAGDPGNELGTRWMPLVPEHEGLPKDLGIHGTIRPETIGYCTSNGCARMYPQDVEELYDLVVRSTPVEIVESYHGEDRVQAPAAPPASAATPAPPRT